MSTTTALHGSLRPPTIPLSEWQKLSKRNKQEVHDKWMSKALPSGDSALQSAAGVQQLDDNTPRMPCKPATTKHRQRYEPELPHYNVCVARTVKPAEVKVNTKAQAAMEMEWRRLGQVPRKDLRSEFGMRTLSRNGPQCGAMRESKIPKLTWG